MATQCLYCSRDRARPVSTVYLGLGSNLEDKRRNIESALALIAERVGGIRAVSTFHETQPWGYNSKKQYLNIAAAVETMLNPAKLLVVTQVIEHKVGRHHKTVNGEYYDRPIDIDILLYNDLILQSETLTIPHPLMHQRLFVLQPLSEIAPHEIHPVLKKSIAVCTAELCDSADVNIWKK